MSDNPSSGGVSPASPLARLAAEAGLDRAVVFTVLTRGWSVVAVPVTLYCIAHFLTGDEQGYYYTFDSLLGLQVFFDLGIAFVVLQFASHEKAHLEWTASGTLAGAAVHKARLASLLAGALKAYSLLAILLVLTVLPAGLWFFTRLEGTGQEVVWRGPWQCSVWVTAGNLMLSPLLAVIEGCGLVAEVARLRLLQQVVGTLFAWLAFVGGARLYAAPVLNAGYLLTGVWWLWSRKRGFLMDLLGARDSVHRVSWKREVFPLQWRIALSWLSGYFTFRLFNPVLFAYQGKEVAGRMGMTMKIIDSLGSVCLAWMTTKAAPFGALIAKREFSRLDRLFFRSLKQSYVLLAIGCLGVTAGLMALRQWHHPFQQRLLTMTPTLLLLGVALMNHLIASQAVYLRAHKQEPFLWLSVATAATIGLSTYLAGRYFGATGAALGYFLNTLLLSLGGASHIFRSNRQAWHN